ncbi:hypothetical protein AAVH_07172 [Aphelenchoides avenae]|nr:hypothetical protein AAVH_07172 [Aphelenchus avenae]
MKPTLSTTCVEVPPLPGKHVMLKVPVVRVPRVDENHGDDASFDQPHCFWSPFLGPIHAFFDAHDIPQGSLLEVDVIKVCNSLKDMFQKKYSTRAEWMLRKGKIRELDTATEDKQLALLQTLRMERIEGVMVRRGDDNCAIAAELPDGGQKLFIAFDSNFEVGDVVSFVPMEVGLDAQLRLAVSCRLSRSGFATPLGHNASQFLIPFSAFTPFGDHYRARYFGLVDDSKNVLKGGGRMPKHVIARINEQYGFFAVAVNVQLEQWTVQATCARVKGGHCFFEWFPTELAKYPTFCVFRKGFVNLAGVEPLPGQWYEMVVRFYASSEDFTGDRLTCVLSARCIPKPSNAREFVHHPALAHEPPKSPEPKASWPEAERLTKQTSPSTSVLHAASINTDGGPSSDNAKLEAKLEPEEQVLTATCTHKKGEDAFFESAETRNGERKKFLATLKSFRDCTAGNDPSPGQQYELTVRFYARATPERAHILAAEALSGSLQPSWSQSERVSSYTVKSAHPSDAEITGGKAKVELEERALKGICLYVKGDETFFKPVPKDSAKYPIFQVNTKTFVEKTGSGEPVAGKLYKLTLKFQARSEKASHVPRAQVITAKTVRNRSRALQFRRVETSSTSSQPPQVQVGGSSAAKHKEERLSKYAGVVCYKDGDVCYVYSAQMGYEIPVESLGRALDAGDWVEFSVNDGDDDAIALNPTPAQASFPTTPVHRSVVVKCSIMVPMDIQETDDTVMSNFVGNVRDIHGLARKVSPGVHDATILYVYDEGRDCGLWQLEYVYGDKL